VGNQLLLVRWAVEAFNLDQAEVTTWAIDTALQVLEYVLVLKGMFTEFQARKSPERSGSGL
jgi:hypothetical protein